MTRQRKHKNAGGLSLYWARLWSVKSGGISVGVYCGYDVALGQHLRDVTFVCVARQDRLAFAEMCGGMDGTL